MPIILTKADRVHARREHFNLVNSRTVSYYVVLSSQGFTSFWMPTGSRTYVSGVQQHALEHAACLRDQLRRFGFVHLLSELSDADRR